MLQWIGLFAAPLAWTVQLVAGFGYTVGACAGTRGWGGSLSTAEIAITVAAAAVALGGQAAAVLAWRATRGTSDSGGPPAGRIHFFATAALLSNTIFLIVILLGGITAVHLSPCRQA
ncbi:MAG TPA: hypothetical protein VF025_12120 [Gaiellaceae bacterium]